MELVSPIGHPSSSIKTPRHKHIHAHTLVLSLTHECTLMHVCIHARRHAHLLVVRKCQFPLLKKGPLLFKLLRSSTLQRNSSRFAELALILRRRHMVGGIISHTKTIKLSDKLKPLSSAELDNKLLSAWNVPQPGKQRFLKTFPHSKLSNSSLKAFERPQINFTCTQIETSGWLRSHWWRQIHPYDP